MTNIPNFIRALLRWYKRRAGNKQTPQWGRGRLVIQRNLNEWNTPVGEFQITKIDAYNCPECNMALPITSMAQLEAPVICDGCGATFTAVSIPRDVVQTFRFGDKHKVVVHLS